MAPVVKRADASLDGTLFYGDNLDILCERIPTSSVDLIYLDPPFNSKRAYNLLFKSITGEDAHAQVKAFEDMWIWNERVAAEYRQLIGGGLPVKTAESLEALHRIIGENAMMAYIVMMAPRLVQMRRVLEPTGSLYLHCDPTASHYLKIFLDAVFGPQQFRNEVIWKRTSAHSDASRYGNAHDVILYYAASAKSTWNDTFQPYEDWYVEKYYRYKDEAERRFMSDNMSASGLSGGGYTYEWHGHTKLWRCPIETMRRLEAEGRIFYTKNGVTRRKRYLDEAKGQPVQDVWMDIEALRSWHEERIGYPTQKPLALINRMIEASTNPGDVVLDPFCGCGTAVDAAQSMGRKWIGIDISYLAIDVVDRRLRRAYGSTIHYEIDGKPEDLHAADDLFMRNALDFERWAVSLVHGEPNEKQTDDKGVDGRIRFPVAEGKAGIALVSVEGGETVNPAMVRELVGTVDNEEAAIGILITRAPPSTNMFKAAAQAGSYTWPLTKAKFPRIQLLTVAELFAGKKPQLPTPFPPYARGKAHVGQQMELIPASPLPKRKRKGGVAAMPVAAPPPSAARATPKENLGLPKVLTQVVSPPSQPKPKKGHEASAALPAPPVSRATEPKPAKARRRKGAEGW